MDSQRAPSEPAPGQKVIATVRKSSLHDFDQNITHDRAITVTKV